MEEDIDELIFEYFEENDWDMSSFAVDDCAEKLKFHFKNKDEAEEYINGYLNALFG